MPDVDAKALVINVLLDDAGVLAVVGQGVYSRLPAQPAFPLLEVRQLGGTMDYLGHVQSPRIAVTAWARHEDEARSAAAAALDALLLLRGTFTEGVVTGTTPQIFTDLPDDPVTGFPRVEFDISVHCHPVPA